MLNYLIPELFREVLSYLSPSDLPILRLASRQVELQTRASFAAAFFSTLKIDFSEPNLQWLANIAFHASFRHAVRSMELAHWASNWGRHEEFALGYGGNWSRLPRGPVDPSSKLAQKFISAVHNLPSCTRVSITDVGIQRGPPQAGIDAFGLNLKPAHHLSPLDALELFLHAYSLPAAAPLRDLCIRVTNKRYWPACTALSSSTMDAVLPNWTTNAENFLLEFLPGDEGMPLLLRLLTAATGLKSLRLTWEVPEEDCGFLYGLGYGIRRESSSGSQLLRCLEDYLDSPPPLDTLALRGISTSEANLLDLLSRCRDTLTNLSLSSVGLSTGTWTSVLKHLRSLSFPNLRNFSMYGCTQQDTRSALAFCHLFQSREALEPFGGTFDFATGGRYRITPHIIGVLFQSEYGATAFKVGLRAIMDKCHVFAYEERPARCEALGGVPNLPADAPNGPLAARHWWITAGERNQGGRRTEQEQEHQAAGPIGPQVRNSN